MITLNTRRGGFAEIYRDGLHFTLMKRTEPETYSAYHGSTCCKDFFTDIFWSEEMQQPTQIHGFAWTPGTLVKEPYFFMCLEHSKALGPMEGKVRNLLNAFEAQYNFPPSMVRTVGTKLLVAFSAEWTKRPVLVSMVTGLMRLGMVFDPNEGVEAFFARLLKEGNPFGQYDRAEFGKHGVVQAIMDSYRSGIPPHPKQTFNQYDNPYQCHHSGGLIAYTTGRATG